MEWIFSILEYFCGFLVKPSCFADLPSRKTDILHVSENDLKVLRPALWREEIKKQAITLLAFYSLFRLARIAENMAKMPEIVADYRERMREKRAKLKKEKEEARLRKINAQRLGYDVRDPRALMAMKGELADLKRKNRWKRPKKVKLGTIA